MISITTISFRRLFPLLVRVIITLSIIEQTTLQATLNKPQRPRRIPKKIPPKRRPRPLPNAPKQDFIEGSSQQFTNKKKLFAWVVTHPHIKGKMYLVGSVHAGKASFYPLSPVIESAFAESEALAVEVDMSAHYWRTWVAIQDFVQTQAIFHTFWPLLASTLIGYVASKEEIFDWDWQSQILATLALLSAYCALNVFTRGNEESTALQDAFRILKLPLYEQFFAKCFILAPSTMRTFLREKLRRNITGSSHLSMEWYFIRAAQKAKKKVLEIETIAQQHAMQAKIRDTPEFATFQKFLEDFPLLEDYYKKIIIGFNTGNTAFLYHSLLYDKERTMNFEQLMLIDRHKIMLKKIKMFFSTKKTIFVLVGAMHYIGNKGILALLKREGYIIEQLTEEVSDT